MLEPEEKEEFERGKLLIKILWLLCLAALVIYVIISYLLVNHLEKIEFSDSSLGIIEITLYIIAVVSLVLAYFFRKSMLTVRPTGSKPNVIQQMFISNTQLFAFSSHPAVRKYMTAVLLPLAISESVGIYGVILFIISREFVTLYPFIVISAIALYFFRPKSEELEQLAMAMRRSS